MSELDTPQTMVRNLTACSESIQRRVQFAPGLRGRPSESTESEIEPIAAARG
jgi:hypothetical protein